jgi:glyoxylase-like metal-dependent hydrolase (beta-lactamase superfamily II)
MRRSEFMQTAERVTDGVYWLRTLIANVCFVASDSGWVLVDAGVRGHAGTIRRSAEALFGANRPPQAIVLTHAHFDHVGSLKALLTHWDVPVYAHTMELPYLTGRSSYPPPDPLVGGGAMAWLAKLYPRRPIDLDGRVQALSSDGAVPGLDGWKWLATPGHTAGHVSLLRERDRVVIAGDAVTTTQQESLVAVATQRMQLHGPPAYFTQNWYAAAQSVRTLADTEPLVLVTGHGRPMSGPWMRDDLHALADRFETDEVPKRGRYVRRPAQADERGTFWVPPDPLPNAILRVAAPLAFGAAALILARRSRDAQRQSQPVLRR